MVTALSFYIDKTLVHWNGRKCIHKAKCLKSLLPDLFKTDEDCILLNEDQKNRMLLNASLCPMEAFTVQEVS